MPSPTSNGSANGKAHNRLVTEQTAGYKPTVIMHPYWLDQTMPPFTIWTIERMRIDPQVKLSTAVRYAPLMRPQFEIVGSPDITRFVSNTLRAVWTKSIRKIVKGMAYSMCAGEILYDYDEKTRMFHFRGLNDIYPTDVRIRTLNGKFTGLRIRMHRARNSQRNKGRKQQSDVVIRRPKAFIYLNEREFGSWVGKSMYESSYKPWFDKAERDGGIDIRRMWYYKCAFDAGDIYHPSGNYIEPETGQIIPYQDIARQIVEQGKTGGVYAWPNDVDENGVRKWERRPAGSNGTGGDLINYVDQLDVEISRGMLVPDDIVSQQSGTGSYAGRAIPLATFMAISNVAMTEIASAVDELIVKPLVEINFGKDARYELLSAKVNDEELQAETPGQNEDADADGMVNDGTPQEQPVDEEAPIQLSRLLEVGMSQPIVTTVTHDDAAMSTRSLVSMPDWVQLGTKKEQRRAPIGGITIGGKFYRGGLWIPDEAWAVASKEQRAEIRDFAKGVAPSERSLPPKGKPTSKKREMRKPTPKEVDIERAAKNKKLAKDKFGVSEARNKGMSAAARRYKSKFRDMMDEIAAEVGVSPEEELSRDQQAEIARRIATDPRFFEEGVAPAKSTAAMFGVEWLTATDEEKDEIRKRKTAEVPDTDKVGQKYAVTKHLSQILGEEGILDWDSSRPDPETYSKMVDAVVHDLLFSIAQDPSSLTWYEDQVENSFHAMALSHPEMTSDSAARKAGFLGNDSISPSEEAKQSFLAILAITSNGQAVNKHFDETLKQFNDFKEHKDFSKLDMSWAGTTKNQMKDSLDLMQSMVDMNGGSIAGALEFLNKPMSVSSINRLSKFSAPSDGLKIVDTKGVMGKAGETHHFDPYESIPREMWDQIPKGDRKEIQGDNLGARLTENGLSKNLISLSGEHGGEGVFGAMVFGPKIGSFYGNMNGQFGTVTQDRWFTRAMETRAGTAIDHKPSRVRSAATRLLESLDPKLKQKVLGDMSSEDIAQMKVEGQRAAKGKPKGIRPRTKFSKWVKAAAKDTEHPLHTQAKKALSDKPGASIQIMLSNLSGWSNKEKFLGFKASEIRSDLKEAAKTGHLKPGSAGDLYAKEKMRIYNLGDTRLDGDGNPVQKKAKGKPMTDAKGNPVWDKESFLNRNLHNVAAKGLKESNYVVNEAPRGSDQRSINRQIIDDAVGRLAETGINISPSSGQAVDWFHAKELWKLYGAGSAKADPADYESAALKHLYETKGDAGLKQYMKTTGLSSGHVNEKLRMAKVSGDVMPEDEENDDDDET